jgi:RNA polymerase sigma-70 factor, ECF subfamily
VRQRNLLRQHILDELTIDDLARLYRVHRATCARWLADARADLGKQTRKRLMSALGMPTSDVDSLLRFLDSDIELSISRILMSR